MEAATNTNSNLASKAVNIAIGAVIIAILVTGGILIYMYTRSDGNAAVNRSVEQWEQSVKENPNSSLARANLGAAYLDAGMVDEAIQELKIALDQEPRSFTYMEKLGHAYRAKGDFTAAIDMFQQSAELAPAGDKDNAYFWAAQSYLESGDVEAALTNVIKSIEDRDINWNSHFLKGQIHEKKGEYPQAREEYQKAAKFNPDDPAVQEAMGRLPA